jgi:hypothetical protein
MYNKRVASSRKDANIFSIPIKLFRLYATNSDVLITITYIHSPTNTFAYNATANNPRSAAATPISILPAAPVDCAGPPVDVPVAPPAPAVPVPDALGPPVAVGTVTLPLG